MPFAISDDVFLTSISSYYGRKSYDATLYVPYRTLGKYKATAGWANNFKTIVERTYVIDGICYGLNNSSMTAGVVSNANSEYSGAVTIPASVEYNGETYSVTSIGDNAFYRCTGLTSVTIPNSVTSIGRGAFFESRSSITIVPDSIISIGSAAFGQRFLYLCVSQINYIVKRVGFKTNL